LFFDRPESGERALLVHLNLSSEAEREDPREFEELVLSAGGDPVELVLGQRDAPHPRYFVGTGKLDEIASLVTSLQVEVVLFNHALSPSQERNLEQALKCRVLDRTGLILDIFAQRARTHEGKLQVELAQLQHMSTRLVRGWTHLERQKGGIGLRGPGETQLETDRRLLRARIKTIQARLDRVGRQRASQRRSRRLRHVDRQPLILRSERVRQLIEADARFHRDRHIARRIVFHAVKVVRRQYESGLTGGISIMQRRPPTDRKHHLLCAGRILR